MWCSVRLCSDIATGERCLDRNLQKTALPGVLRGKVGGASETRAGPGLVAGPRCAIRWKRLFAYDWEDVGVDASPLDVSGGAGLRSAEIIFCARGVCFRLRFFFAFPLLPALVLACGGGPLGRPMLR